MNLHPPPEQQAQAPGGLVIRFYKRQKMATSEKRIKKSRLGINHVFSISAFKLYYLQRLTESVKPPYPSATGKLLCVLLKPGEGELLTYVISGQGEHWNRPNTSVSVPSEEYHKHLNGFSSPLNFIYSFIYSHLFINGPFTTWLQQHAVTIKTV